MREGDKGKAEREDRQLEEEIGVLVLVWIHILETGAESCYFEGGENTQTKTYFLSYLRPHSILPICETFVGGSVSLSRH